jgi:serine protease DegS
MSLLQRFFLALLKPVILGVVVATILLFAFPEFREGEGLDLRWLNSEENIPPRLSYYQALERSAPAVANIYSVSLDNSNRFLRSRTSERTNLGSGVIMSEDGYILTCYHVIKNADSIYAALQDSRVVPAQLIGFDEVTDLAVLKVRADGLQHIPQMAEPDLRVGDVVMAIGNPLDLGQTITSGIVSRTGFSSLANYFDFVQTDAVLNPGNSGGALVDSNGYLVGITNANFKTIDSRSNQVQDVEGVNFAAPYPLAKRIMDEIIENGTVRRGHLGFSGEAFINEKGIIVRWIDTDGAADIAGLRVNDVILTVDGVEIDDAAAARDYIAESTPGSEMVLVIRRDDKLITMTAVVAELNPRNQRQFAG